MKPFAWKPLSREDTQLYKGAAILSIALHNFLHLVRPTPAENEFDFSAARLDSLLAGLAESPEDGIRLVFSFFGHFGVQLFIFLSAYGLTFSCGDRRVAWTHFMTRRLARIYPTFVLAIGLFCVVIGLPHGVTGPISTALWHAKSLALMLTFTAPFVPGMALSPVGPWWFISFIFQFYAVFLVLNAGARRFGSPFCVALAALGVLMLAFVNPLLTPHELNLKHNVLGYLPEIALGMALARAPRFELPWVGVAAVALVFAAGSAFAWAWPLSFAAALVLLLIALQAVRPALARLRWLKTALCYYGGISLELFLVNGFLREPFLGIAARQDSVAVVLLLALSSLGTATLAAHALQIADARLRAALARRRRGQPNAPSARSAAISSAP